MSLETHKLQRRIVSYAMLGILLTGVVVGLATAIPYYNHTRASLEEVALGSTRLRALAVAQLLDKWDDLTLQITSRSVIREKLEAYYQGRVSRTELVEFSVPKLADAMRLSADISGIARLDREGAPIIEVGTHIPLPFLPDPAGVRREPRPRGPVAFAGAYHLLIAAPIFNAGGERVGTDVVAFRVDALLTLMHQAIHATPESRAYLGHRDDGTILEARTGGGGILRGAPPATLTQGLGRAQSGQAGVLRPEQLGGTSEVIIHIPVDEAWGLVVAAPGEALYAPALGALIPPAASILVMILLGTIGTIRLIRPLSVMVIEKTSELATLTEEQRSLLEHARGFVYRNDAEGRLTYVSGNVETITGFAPEEFLAGFHHHLTDHPDNRRAQGYAAQVRAGEHVPPYTVELLHRNGSRVVLEISERPTLDEAGHLRGVFGVARDVTERVRTGEALEASEERLRTVIDATPDIICFKDAHGRWLEANHANLKLFGLNGVEYRGRRDSELAAFAPPPFRDAFLASEGSDEQAWHRGAPLRTEEIVPTLAGERLYFDLLKVPLFAEDGSRKGLVVVGRDITERKWAEEELHLAASVFSGTHEGILITDTAMRVMRVNEAGARSLGSAAEGRGLCDLLDASRSPPDLCQQIATQVAACGSWQGEVWYRHQDGQVVPAWQHVSGVLDEQGQVVRYIALFTDLSEKKDSEERIRYLADFDPLTNLPNRTLFTQRLGEAVTAADRLGQRLALLFIDLDRFKNVNDSLGHPVGDRLLQEVAGRLHAKVREQDTVARLGGDEFTVLIGELNDPRDAGAVANKLLEELARPVAIDGYDIFVAASIGISLFPDDGQDARTLIRNADAAMYRAKEKGRNTYQFYTPELTNQSFERLDLEAGLRRALERSELVLQYQPQAAGDGAIVGVEALVRWNHPERGMVSPTTFIPLAEDTGLIEPIGEWVLMAACAQAAAWRTQGISLRMAVNLSGYQIVYGDVVGAVRRALAASGLPAAQLELEITEGFVLSHAEQGINTLNELRALGVQLAIDDFGTGYSSLSYLKRLPIDRLKIDRSFVRDIPEDRDDVAITTTIIGMARHLGLKVIAEGVETAVQLEFLRQNGCDEFQGYHLSRPLFAADLEAFLRGRAVRVG